MHEVLAQIDPNFLLSHTLLWCTRFIMKDTMIPTPTVRASESRLVVGAPHTFGKST